MKWFYMYLRLVAFDVSALQGIFNCWIFFQCIFNFATGINDKHITENDTWYQRIPTTNDKNDNGNNLTRPMGDSYSEFVCAFYQMFFPLGGYVQLRLIEIYVPHMNIFWMQCESCMILNLVHWTVSHFHSQ